MSTDNGGTNTHGGYRPGAGRKPKALRYGVLADQIEERISLALPRIIDAMIERAERGDNVAAKYLCDRILGHPAKLPAAPANDTELPYNEKHFEDTLKKHGYTIDIAVPPSDSPSLQKRGLGAGYTVDFQADANKINEEILNDTEIDIKDINDHYCVYRLNDIENAKLNFDYNRRDRILNSCSETLACEENIDNPAKFFHYSTMPGIGDFPNTQA